MKSCLCFVEYVLKCEHELFWLTKFLFSFCFFLENNYLILLVNCYFSQIKF